MTAAIPISVLSLNPAVDMTYEVAELKENQKSHASATRYDPGGNGVNVGRALKTLGVNARHHYIIAGEIGRFLERMLEKQLDNIHYVYVDGETRINVTLLEQSTTAQYEISGVGPALNSECLTDLLAEFIYSCDQGLGVLTGAVPPGVPKDIYGLLAARIHEQGGRAVVDTHGVLLQYALKSHPFLIKPNRHELETYCGKALASLDEIVAEARRIQRESADYVCVSLGADGAILAGPDKVLHAVAPPVQVNCTVGAGDSMVAGMVAAFSRGESAEDALKLGIACGCATARHPGTELFVRDEINPLIENIEVRYLDR
ncbi:MAG TPA: 1-phosphofructokinase family hexose kinase [Gallionella sp.]|nr:1-phosphofructokinase family hexose kinase [Gallionella sp.]